MSTIPEDIDSQQKQAGMVAIMVTLILMIVISLIVLGFAQISRRNQRQALDRQLSTQAFYAAETGVNDAAELIKNATQTGAVVASKPDCSSTGGGFYAGLNSVLDSSTNVEYTCLLVDPTPTSLVYSSVGSNSTVVPITASSGTIGRLTISWQSKEDSSTPISGCPNSFTNVFKPTASWTCGYGVLRFDLVPTAGAALTAGGLQSSTMTSFMVPFSSGGSPVYSYVTSGNELIKAPCDNTGCSVTINALSSTQYYLRISSLYKDSSVQVSIADAAANPLKIQGAQALVDVTGKAQDVLRRIQVRVPLSGSSTNLLSDYAIQSTEAICKRFSVMDGFFDNNADDVVAGVAASTSNPLCRP